MKGPVTPDLLYVKCSIRRCGPKINAGATTETLQEGVDEPTVARTESMAGA